MGEKIKIDYQNYDTAIKNAFTLFEGKVPTMIDKNLPQIKEFINTEIAEIETKKNYLDIDFLLEDDTILHIEEELRISEEDMIRFAIYDLKLYRQHKKKIRTYILTTEKTSKNEYILNTGTVDSYRVKVISFENYDGDLVLKKIKESVEEKKEINELEFAMLPLMKSSMKREKILEESLEIIKAWDTDYAKKEKILAIMIVLSDKFVERSDLEKIWEGFKMLKIFQIAEEKGME